MPTHVLFPAALCSTLAGGRRVERSGRPSSRRLLPVAARWGGQGRPQAGTGAARSHAQRPLGREHGEHGEDLPLERTEHRGTGSMPRTRTRTRTRARALRGFSKGF